MSVREISIPLLGEKFQWSRKNYRRLYASGFLLFAALFLIFFRIDFPAKQYFDEVYFVTSARQYVELNPYIMENTHPPLGKLLIAACMKVLGDHPAVWRLISAVSGILLLPVFGGIVWLLTRRFWMSYAAAWLLLIEGIHLTQSRITMLNVPMVLMMLLSLLMAVRYIVDPKAPRLHCFIWGGIFAGLAVSWRWVGISVLQVVPVFLLPRFFRSENKILFIRDYILCWILIPLAVYFLSHLYMLVQGHPLKYIWDYQVNMHHYHSHLKEQHGYGSEWWGWPLLVRPIWYFFERRNNLVYGIICIGNPALYWMIPFAMGYVLFKWLEERKFIYGMIAVGFFFQWLPWMLIGRVKFFHYFYPAVPFALLAILLLMDRIWSIGKRGKALVILYGLAVIVLFIFWYPLLTGLPISEAYFRSHLWFKKWI